MNQNSFFKCILTTGLLSIVTGILNCTSFPTSYDRIAASEVRLLDFIYEPVDAAPGDSVTVKAVFAGKQLDLNTIDWKISYQVYINDYGSDTAINFIPLNRIPVDFSFSDNTQSLAFRFKIPENAIRNSTAIPENILSMVPEALKDQLPEELTSLKKSDLINLVETYASLPQLPEDSTLQEMLPQLLQLLTVRACIKASIPGEYVTSSTFTIRYNNLFSSAQFVPVNRNPRIDSIGVYKVKGQNILRFDSEKYEYEFIKLYGRDETSSIATIPVAKGYTYFIAAFTGDLDETITLDGNTILEQHNCLWFLKDPIQHVNYTKWAAVQSDGSLIGTLYPPLNPQITDLTCWLQVFDNSTNETFRPSGSTLAEFHATFEYVPGYF